MSEEASPGPMGEVVKAGRVSLDAWARVAEAAIPEPQRFAGRRIALDAANGAGIKLLPWLKEAIPAEWVIIGSGGVINDKVGSEHPEALCAVVQTEG